MFPVDLPHCKFDWPQELWLALEMFGYDLLYQVGLDALGYPPTWMTYDPSDEIQVSIFKDAFERFDAELTRRIRNGVDN
jgi:hypothetical protein